MKISSRKERALRAGKPLLELLCPRSARRIMEEKEERRTTRASLPHSPFLECHAILAVFCATLQKILDAPLPQHLCSSVVDLY